MSRRPLAFLVVLAVVAVVAGPTLLERSPLRGIDGLQLPELTLPDIAPTLEPTPRATPVPVPGHEVYGFVPYWEMDGDIVEHVAGTRLTSLGLFSVTQTRSGALDTKQNGYRLISGDIGRRLARAAQDAGTRVELVYTSFGEAKNARFFADADAQTTTIAQLIGLVRDLHLDGIDVDVESLAVTDIPAYGDFVGRLRKDLLARLKDAQVSVATGSGLRGAAMAEAAITAGADRVFVMGYDYHWAGSTPGASAPLAQLGDDHGDLPSTLELYVQAGVPVQRTILGLPLYGMAWPVDSAQPDAVRTGRGEPWVPSQHLAILRDPKNVPTRDDIEVVERLVLKTNHGWQAIYYDSPATLAPKLDLANASGLAGAGFWALGYERGLPDYTTLIARFAVGKDVIGG